MHGIDISKQSARQFTVTDFSNFDLILAMDKSNLEHLQSLARSEDDLSKLRLFLSFNTNTHLTEVPDPYYGQEDGFNFVYNLVNDTTSGILEWLQKQ